MGLGIYATCIPAMCVLQWFMLKKEMGCEIQIIEGQT